LGTPAALGASTDPAASTGYAVENWQTEQGLPRSTITAIAQTSEGYLWLGSPYGISRFDGVRFVLFEEQVAQELGRGDGRARFAGVEHGLHDNVITQMVEDDAGFAWFGSSRGIFRVRLAELEKFADGERLAVESIPHGRSDGLVNVECSSGYQPSACKTKSGRLRFGTSKGVILVDPASLSFNDRPPPLVLEQVVVDGSRGSPQCGRPSAPGNARVGRSRVADSPEQGFAASSGGIRRPVRERVLPAFLDPMPS
jgi:hypothetical protein